METLERRVSHIEGKLNSVATKEDVANLRAEMIDHIAKLRAEIAEFETRMIGMEARMLKWTMGTVLAGMALAVTVGIAF